MVIEISTCIGNYELSIQDKLITKDNFDLKSLSYTEIDEMGKKVIYLQNLNSKHYYLSIRSQGIKFLCELNNISEENCGTNLQYLIYYFTTYSDNLSFQDIDKWISHRPYGRGRVRLDLPIIIMKDLDINEKSISDYKFDVFGTKDKDYINSLGNICYLSKYTNLGEKVFKIGNLYIENKNSLIISDLKPGNRYYINVLAQNIKTKELITFHPIEILTGGRHPKYWWRFSRNILIIFLFIILIFYIYKYRKAKEELIFLKGEAQTKTQSEMSGYDSMKYNAQNIKYSTLGTGY